MSHSQFQFLHISSLIGKSIQQSCIFCLSWLWINFSTYWQSSCLHLLCQDFRQKKTFSRQHRTCRLRVSTLVRRCVNLPQRRPPAKCCRSWDMTLHCQPIQLLLWRLQQCHLLYQNLPVHPLDTQQQVILHSSWIMLSFFITPDGSTKTKKNAAVQNEKYTQVQKKNQKKNNKIKIRIRQQSETKQPT